MTKWIRMHHRSPRAFSVIAGGAAAALIWLAASAAGIDLAVPQGAGAPDQIGPRAVVLTSGVAVLAGWALLAALERVTARARQIWTGIAVAVVVASLVPLWTSGASGEVISMLGLMHLSVGAVSIPLLARTAST